MKLTARIHEKEYDIVQGCTFSEEYNETLDSGNIIITHVKEIKDFNPYDDVYIYEKDKLETKTYTCITGTTIGLPYLRVVNGKDLLNKRILFYNIKDDNGFQFKIIDKNEHKLVLRRLDFNDNSHDIILSDEEVDNDIGAYNVDYDLVVKRTFTFEVEQYQGDGFYKHLLIDQRVKRNLTFNLGENELYEYTIQLFSEVKALEKIQCPNTSITNPLRKSKRKTAYEYIKMFVDMYSPLEKVALNDSEFVFIKKYSLSPQIKEAFGKSYCPDMTLNLPSLRDLLSKIFIVNDMIPYVKENVIYAMDISETNGYFQYVPEELSFIQSSLSSQNYCNKLQRTYSEALTSSGTCLTTEYIGFRNSDMGLMTLTNMRIQTRFPIYRIKKVMMCYYICVPYSDVSHDDEVRNMVVWVEQDITKLVKLNNERNLLSQDWNAFKNLTNIRSIDDLAKFRMGTIGYSIGSNVLQGWGEYTDYPDFIYDKKTTYIQDIINKISELGLFGKTFYAVNKERENNDIYYIGEAVKDNVGNIKLYSPFDNASGTNFHYTGLNFGAIVAQMNMSLKYKAPVFKIEYEAFYNGTAIQTKEELPGNITTNDNASSSLTLLESDGIAQKEKVNRFSNEGYTINSRYETNNANHLGHFLNNNVGVLWQYNNNDIVLYHRDYSIYENVITCKYQGTKNYVLKNYFTSVYAKHRTYNLMSYGESIRRSCNNLMYVYLSKDKLYFENKDNNDKMIAGLDILYPMLNCYENNKEEYERYLITSRKKYDINYGYLIHDGNGFYYDVNKFIYGNSLCFNLAMDDNISAGTAISVANPFNNQNFYLYEYKDDYTGSKQKWYSLADDNETGFTENMGIYICHYISDLKTPKINLVAQGQETDSALLDVDRRYEEVLFINPKIADSVYENGDIKDGNVIVNSNVIGKYFNINKDNKEIIDMTYQFDTIVGDDDVKVGNYFMKLSDLYGVYNKFDIDYEIPNEANNDGFGISIFHTNVIYSLNGEYNGALTDTTNYSFIVLQLKENQSIKAGDKINSFINYPYLLNRMALITGLKASSSYIFLKDVVSASDDTIVVNAKRCVKLLGELDVINGNDYYGNGEKEIQITFRKVSNTFCPEINNQVPNNEKWYSNLEISLSDDTIKYNNVIIYSDFNKTVVNGQEVSFTDMSLYNSNHNNCIVITGSNYNGNVLINEQHGDYLIGTVAPNTLSLKKNMFIYLSDEFMDSKVQYTLHTNDDSDFISRLNMFNSTVQDIFSWGIEDEKRYIKIKLPTSIFVTNQDILTTYKSIQYWYYDEETECYNFVMGVNIRDKTQTEIKLYVSLITSFDKNVYNASGKKVGEIENYADDETTEEFGSGQFYKKCDNI